MRRALAACFAALDGQMIRRFLCGHPNSFRTVRDLGCVPVRCSCSLGFPEVVRSGGSQRLPRMRVNGSGGRLFNLANLCLLPVWTYRWSLRRPGSSRIYPDHGNRPGTASCRSQALMSDQGRIKGLVRER